MKIKLLKITAKPISLGILLKGQLFFLSQYFEVIGVSSPEEFLHEVAEKEQIIVKGIYIERHISLISDLKSLFRLYCYFKIEKPTIIHSITPKAGLLSMIAGFLAGVPIRIHTFTGLVFPSHTGWSYFLLKNMDRLTCAFATKIIPEGEGVKRDLIKNKVTLKPLQIIGNGNVNGIDASYFSPNVVSDEQQEITKQSYGIAYNDFVFVFIGRLVKDKGINELVKAFEAINELYPSTKLLLLGNFEQHLDPLEAETLYKIQNNSKIVYTGFLSDVRPYLAISHALVFPSYREGFPNVPMQALAMEVPAIVTDINGCNEIVIHEQNGLIIPPKNTRAIMEAMQRLMNDQVLYNHLKSNARESIVSRYDQLTLWKLIKEEYDEQLRLAGITS